MTLVVAKLLNGRALVVADTKISWPPHGPNLPRANMPARQIGRLQDGCLKNVVISPDICVCWAGDLYFADEAFKEIWSGAIDLKHEVVLSHYLKWHVQSGGRTDFIVLQQKQEDEIARISNGKIDNVEDLAWIGSPNAFSKFSGLIANEDITTDLSLNRVEMLMFQLDDLKGKACDPLLETMTQAMRSVSFNASFSDVGDFVVPVGGTDGGFRYFIYMSFDANFVPPSTTDKWEKVDLGDVDTGAYNFQLIEYKDDVVRVPILHFLQARYALSFSDRNCGVPRIVAHGPESELVVGLERAARRRNEAMKQREEGSK